MQKGGKVMEVRSSFKEWLKQHTRVKSGLKVCFIIGSHAMIGALQSHITLPNEIIEPVRKEVLQRGMTIAALDDD
jgi:hypothetical protein